MKKIIAVLTVLTLMFAISACSDKGENITNNKTNGIVPSDNTDIQNKTDEEVQIVTEKSEDKTVLYIGTADSSFKEYEIEISGELTAEKLIDEIENLTGWNLELADMVTSGKGGMTVCFANTSSLFVGPPEVQKDEFHVFGGYQLAQTILDSVKKTLQMNFVSELGDPDSLDIYYCMEGDKPLEIPSIGKGWSLEEPYKW